MQTFLLPIGRQQIFNHLFCSGITCCHYYQKPIEQLFWKNSKKFNEFDPNKVFVANCKICTTIPHSLATIFYLPSFPALYYVFSRPFFFVRFPPLMKPKKHSPGLTTNLGNVDRRGFSSFKCNYVVCVCVCVCVWVSGMLLVSNCVGMHVLLSGYVCVCMWVCLCVCVCECRNLTQCTCFTSFFISSAAAIEFTSSFAPSL